MFGLVSKKKYDRILLELEKASADERKTFSRMVEYYVENQKLRSEIDCLKSSMGVTKCTD